MKKILGNLVRVLVSVGILAYLFSNIMRDETESALQSIADSPELSAPALAAKCNVTVEQVERIRARCIVLDDTEDSGHAISLKPLSFRERQSLAWHIGPHHLQQSFEKISLGWMMLAIGCIGVVIMLAVVRWHWILQVQGLNIPFWRVFSINFIGLFFNAFMLGATGGDVMKAWYVAHDTHHKKAEAVATVIVDRIIGLLVLFMIALVMMTIYWRRVFDDPKLIWFSIATLAVVLGTVAVTFLGLWKGFADKVPGLRAWLQKLPKHDMLLRMIQAYRAYATHWQVLLKTVTVSVGVHGFSMLAIVCIGKGLGITQATLVDYFLYLPIVNSISAVPITISGFGLREGMYVKMFSSVGVPAAQALAMSLLGYLVVLFWSIVGAGFYLVHRKEIPSADTIAREE
jgi:glycosyltransferase 2 family protein